MYLSISNSYLYRNSSRFNEKASNWHTASWKPSERPLNGPRRSAQHPQTHAFITATQRSHTVQLLPSTCANLTVFTDLLDLWGLISQFPWRSPAHSSVRLWILFIEVEPDRFDLQAAPTRVFLSFSLVLTVLELLIWPHVCTHAQACIENMGV